MGQMDAPYRPKVERLFSKKLQKQKFVSAFARIIRVYSGRHSARIPHRRSQHRLQLRFGEFLRMLPFRLAR